MEIMKFWDSIINKPSANQTYQPKKGAPPSPWNRLTAYPAWAKETAAVEYIATLLIYAVAKQIE